MAEAGERMILIVHPGSLGDVVLSLPAIRSLRVAYPRDRLVLLAGSEIGQLLERCGEVDRSLAIEHGLFAGLLAGSGTEESPPLPILAGCRLAVCWMADQDGRIRKAFERIGINRIIVESPHQAGPVMCHQAARFLHTVRDLAPARVEHRWLHLDAEVLRQARRAIESLGFNRAGPRVVLHVGSGSRHKCCAPALFAETISWIEGCGGCPLLLCGPADEEMVARVVAECRIPPRVLRGLSLCHAAGVLSHASLYIGHDSGLTHVSAALGVSTVALFGPTDVRRWSPCGPHVTVLSGEPCRCTSWPAVQSCREKPCLNIPRWRLSAACVSALSSPIAPVHADMLPLLSCYGA